MSSTMYSKSPKIKRNKLEIDIERCRSECKWFKARELSIPLKNEKLSSILGSLYALVSAESILEVIANERENIEISEAKEVKDFLDDALGSVDDGYKMEAKILLAKLRYLQHKYQEAVNSLEALNLKSFRVEQGQARSTKLIAEGFAIIGLSIEELEGSSTEPMNKEAYEKIMENLELAGDLCIYHVQEVDKSVTFTTPNIVTTNIINTSSVGLVGLIPPTTGNELQNEYQGLISKILSKAIQHSPILAIRQGHLSRAVTRYRTLLRYSETDSTKTARQTLSRQLAEVLMRGMCESNYERCVVEAERPSGMTTSTAAMWRVPSKYPSERYIPQDLGQETVLLLLISEFLANQEAVLNRSPELKEARLATLHNSQTVYDLLAIALSRQHCYVYLAQLLQHALRFSYKEWHTWYQLGLCLMSAGHFQHSCLVLKECQRIDDSQVMPFMLASQLHLESLGQIDEGLAMAERARDMCLQDPQKNSLASRCRVLVARGLSLLAMKARVIVDKRQLQKLAIEELQLATELDPNDYLSRYLLAVELATNRQLRQATQSCLSSIRLSPQHSPSLHLLALLYTASGCFQEALSVIDGALIDHPSNITLHKTRAKLHLTLVGKDAAIKAYRGVLEAYKEQENEMGPQYSQMATGSTVASRLETTGSSNLGGVSSGPPSSDDSKYGQMEAMLGLAELYLNCDRIEEAKKCLEAVNGLGSHYQLLYLRGRVFEEVQEIKEARNHYESALAINSGHLGALQHLAKVLQRLRHYQLSEKTLRDALSVDPNNSVTWQLLGELFTEMCARDNEEEDTELETSKTDSLPLTSLSKFDNLEISDSDDIATTGSMNVSSHKEIVAFATKCLGVAADLELTEPLESFYVLPRSVKQFQY